MNFSARAGFVALLILGFASVSVVALGAAGAAKRKCPRGTTPVEDFASGKIKCEGRDILDTTTLRPRGLRAPGKPGKPGKPGAPKKPMKAQAAGAGNCGLAKWGCEEACQQTYLSSATGTTSGAAQRAKVALQSCLRVCGKEFHCKATPPKVP
ncbi:MAG: hypothetical protein V3V56_06505 [bacterium]